jgi:plasmid stabilization system protein ParE
MVPELGQADIREVFVDHYRIVYHVEADGISILTVFEGHQLFKL